MDATGGESRFQRPRPLGRGGTAEVSAVYDDRRKLNAALKSPLPDSQDSARIFSRLAEREVHLIYGERFPGLVRLLDYSTSSPEYLLLELCSGPTLDKIGRIDDQSTLLNVFSSLALDLAFLKARGIIHGDIKPHNFFVPTNWQDCNDGRLFYAKLSDFSLGRLESEPDSARAGVGTVGYMAPETIVNGRTSHQSDLFALGVIAYQLASGQHPFMHDDCEPVRVNARVTEEQPRPLGDIRPDLSNGLVETINSLLAKNESNRPRNAIEVCRTLENLGSSFPYRKALRPTHLLTKASSYERALEAALHSDLRKSSHLVSRTTNDVRKLRRFLDANHRRGTIHFDGERFVSIDRLYWPVRMRNDELAEFIRLRFADKRRAINDAVIFNPDTHSGTDSQARSELLLQLLRQNSVKRIASANAPLEEKAGKPASASRLYLLAGDLENAERCALDVATRLRADHAPQAALAVLRRIVRFAESRDRLFDVRQSLMLTGDILKETGEADKALTVYRQIVALYDDHAPDTLLAETFNDLGDLYKMKQEFRFGIEALERALVIYRELNDEVGISHTLNNLGNIHWVNSDLGAAHSHYRSALRIQRKRDLKADVASTINNIASIYALRSRYGRSIRLLKLSLNLKKELGHAGEIARTLNNLGYVYAVSGLVPLAVESLEESLAINRRIGSLKEQLFNLENLSETTLQLGRLRQSIQYLEEGLTLSEELQDKPHLATLHLTLASAYLRTGHVTNAERSLASARSFLDQIDHKQAEGFYFIHAARLRRFTGDNDSALSLAMRAAQMANSLDDRHLRLQALLIVTQLSDDESQLVEAKAIAEDLSLHRESLLLAFEQIGKLTIRGLLDSAMEQYTNHAAAIQSMDEDIERPRLGAAAAELLIECGKLEDAARVLDESVSAAQRMGLVPELTQLLTLRARVEGATGAYEKCYATSRQALQLIKQLAENISNESDRAIFLNRRSVQALMTEVRRLGAILGQKQRAE